MNRDFIMLYIIKSKLKIVFSNPAVNMLLYFIVYRELLITKLPIINGGKIIHYVTFLRDIPD